VSYKEVKRAVAVVFAVALKTLARRSLQDEVVPALSLSTFVRMAFGFRDNVKPVGLTVMTSAHLKKEVSDVRALV
jgi:hypothetical protein